MTRLGGRKLRLLLVLVCPAQSEKTPASHVRLEHGEGEWLGRRAFRSSVRRVFPAARPPMASR
jgi:hypothetical protein